MAAVSSAVIGAPVSAVLIILELTQSYEYAVAAMIAVMVCNLLTNRVFGNSFFDRQLLDRGIDLLQGTRVHCLQPANCRHPLPARTMCVPNSSVSGALTCAMKCVSRGHTEAYILDDDKQFVGKVSIYEVIAAADSSIEAHVDTTAAHAV